MKTPPYSIAREGRTCPNCTAISFSEGACEACGWLPLQETEMVFLDQEITCPVCGQERSAHTPICPRCKTEDVLVEGRGATVFGLPFLFLLTAVIGICLALWRLHFLIGGPVTLICVGAGLRTGILAHQRRRAGYPVTKPFIRSVFTNSAFTLVAGLIIFCVVTIGVMAPISGIAATSNPTTIVTGFVVLMALQHAVAFVLAWLCKSRRGTLRSAMRGGFWGLVNSAIVCSVATVFSNPNNMVQPAIAIWILVIYPAIVTIDCCRIVLHHQSGIHAIAFCQGNSLVGWMSAALINAVVMVPTDLNVIAFSVAAMWLPAVATCFLLQQLWSWDDAFPATRSKAPSRTIHDGELKMQ